MRESFVSIFHFQLICTLEKPRGKDLGAHSTAAMGRTVTTGRRASSGGRLRSAPSAALVATRIGTAKSTVALHRLGDRTRATLLRREVIHLVSLGRFLLNGALLRHRIARRKVHVLSATVAALSAVEGRQTGTGTMGVVGRASPRPRARARLGPRTRARLGPRASPRLRARLV
jgi:hypothetical protein